MNYSSFQYQNKDRSKLSKAGHPDFHLWVMSDSYNCVIRGRGIKHAFDVGRRAVRSYRRCCTLGVSKETLLDILSPVTEK